MINKKKEKQLVCDKCGGNSLKSRNTTYPIQFGHQQINVGRVSLRECLECHHLMPTQRGQDKIPRCMATFVSLGQ